MTAHDLSARAALNIAAAAGIPYRRNRRVIRYWLPVARANHMKPGAGNRPTTAAEFFHSYMEDTASERRADERQSRDFDTDH